MGTTLLTITMTGIDTKGIEKQTVCCQQLSLYGFKVADHDFPASFIVPFLQKYF